MLDQGYWPDGIYTAPTDEALRSDIELMRRLGFNMCRKHVKIEPERWYYWCDKLGLLVWQDMPSAGGFPAPVRNDESNRQSEVARQFAEELRQMVGQNINHPSIVMWIAFNEGWGQHDTLLTEKMIKQLDPTRLVVGASGWNDKGRGDVLSLHRYPGPALPAVWDDRAIVCGECGGLGLPVSGHLLADARAWSYTRFQIKEELQYAYSNLLDRILSGQQSGLSGAVITQLTDVETEDNGLVTYDRAVVKLDTASRNLKLAGRPLYAAPSSP